jgi:hypothetical protein
VSETINGRRRAMDAAIKEVVIPVLREAGFTGSLPHLRRASARGMDLLTFQFDKHGGGFVIEVSCCAPEGITTHWGKHIPAKEATAWDIHPHRRHRIQPRPGGGRDSWFRFEHDMPGAVASSVVVSLPEAERWWESQ